MLVITTLVAMALTGSTLLGAQTSDPLIPDAVLGDYEPFQVHSEGRRIDPHQYWWIQSRLRRAGNEFRLDREERVNVLSSRWRILEFDRGYDEASVFSDILAAWEEDGYEEVFRCSGSACGNSQDWANQVFGESILYGLDRRQHYSTGTVGDDVRVLYVVRRGTQLIYSYWLEAIRTRPEDRLASTLVSGQAVPVDDYAPMIWVSLLAQKPDWRLTLVGHAYEGSLEETMQRGQQAGEDVLGTWSEAGIDTDRVRVRSVGYLAPAPESGDRVTVVLPPSLQQEAGQR